MAVTDEKLVSDALGGSQQAYRELVHRYERPVYNLVARMVHDLTLAEDLTQDAFVKAFNRLETFRAEQGKFSNWIFKIAHNTTIDHLRRGSLSTVPLEGEDEEETDYHSILADPDAPSPLASAQHSDLVVALGEAIGMLREEYREVVVLRHQEGLAYDEIAEITELPLGTVKTYLHRARKELAYHLSASGWGPERGETQSPSLS